MRQWGIIIVALVFGLAALRPVEAMEGQTPPPANRLQDRSPADLAALVFAVTRIAAIRAHQCQADLNDGLRHPPACQSFLDYYHGRAYARGQQASAYLNELYPGYLPDPYYLDQQRHDMMTIKITVQMLKHPSH